MILQEKDYIHKKKKKYLILSIIWTSMVIAIFIVGLVLTGTRANLFTVSACLLAIVASLFITRCISFGRYKDGDKERAKMLEDLKGNMHIYHSGIVPYDKGTAYFEHILVTTEKIYFIAYTKEQVEKYGKWVQEVLGGKGISSKQIKFLVAQDKDQMKKHTDRIEKELENCDTQKNPIDVYSNKINEILM
ncbi:MAG: hypothetical protein U0L26_14150 [Cellulosilyticum sp.]|nr:hypothetical protein [Cellulosilyticum sp.]MEE1073497.1 hypothetical protein [Cellulosilyticum sp.]